MDPVACKSRPSSASDLHENGQRQRTNSEDFALVVDAVEEDLVLERDARGDQALVLLLGRVASLAVDVAGPSGDGRKGGEPERFGWREVRDALSELLVESLRVVSNQSCTQTADPTRNALEGRAGRCRPCQACRA